MKIEKVEEKHVDPKKEKEENAQSTRNLFLIVAAIVGLFIIIIVSARLIQPKVLTIDDMVERTLEGKTDPETNYIYNGFVFVKVNTLWYTTWQADGAIYNIPLHYGPLEVESIKAEGQLDERFDSDTFYLTFDPFGEDFAHVALATSELGLNLVKGLGVKIEGACTKNNSDVCFDRDIITCDNTNASVIFIKEAEDEKIIMDGNCLTVQGSGMDLIRAVDRVVLQLYGIMK